MPGAIFSETDKANLISRSLISKAGRDDGLALLAGLALPLAFAPAGWYPLAFASPLILFFAWRNASPRRGFLRGWLYGAGAFGAGVSWIHESFQFSNIGLVFALPLTVVFVAFLALYPALAGYAVRRLRAAPAAAQLLMVYPAVWVLSEWLRGWFLTGFTWLQLGYSQLDSPLAGFIPLGGVYLVSGLVAFIAGLGAFALGASNRSRALCAAGAVVILLGGAWLKNVEFSKDHGSPLKVALVQGNFPQDQKWLPEMRQPTLDRYLTLSRENWRSDLILWPETAVPGLLHRMQPFVESLDAEARSHGVDLMFGIPAVDAQTRGFLNTVLLVGEHRGIYYKRHLVPFGEYLPLDGLLRPVTQALGIPVSNFSRGAERQKLLTVAGHAASVSICYEIAFGGEIIRELPEARLLITLSNDAWFGESMGPLQHLEIARARALETGRYLLRATNTGVTAIVGPDGEVRAQAPQFAAAVLSGEITPRTGATPYVRLGDIPIVIAALVLALLPLVVARIAGRKSAPD